MKKENKCSVCGSLSVEVSIADFVDPDSGDQCYFFGCTNEECQHKDKIIKN